MLYILLSILFYPFLILASSVRRRKRITRILVIQTAKIGDMVCSTAVLRRLKQSFPGARLAVMADPAACGILEANPLVDKLFPLKAENIKGLGRKLGLAGVLMRERFDLSVCLLPNITNTIIPLWAIIPRRLSVGPDRPGLTFRLASLFNDVVVWHDTTRSIPETYEGLLKKGLNLPDVEEATRLELPVTTEAIEATARILLKGEVEKTDLVVGMAPAARNKLKEVSPALYAEIADELIKKFSAKVLLIGGPNDAAETKAVIEKMSNPAIDTSGKLKVSELPALLTRMDLFISVDSGPVYMAVAMGVPTINMAGPCAMEERPLGTQNIVIQKNLECAPCSYTFHTATTCAGGDRECITTLTPGPIIEAAEKLLKLKIEQKTAREDGQKKEGAPARGSL